LGYDLDKRFLWLRDLSSNGTFINGALVGRGRLHELNDGDEISIAGKASFTLRYPPGHQFRIFEESYILEQKLEAYYYVPGVFLCREIGEDEEYICKFIPKESADSDVLRRDIAKIEGLRHTNILQIRRSFESQYGFHLVLEQTGGESLFRLIAKRQRLSEDEVRAVFSELFSGVKYLVSLSPCFSPGGRLGAANTYIPHDYSTITMSSMVILALGMST